MSAICGEFVQNAWRKDLCSNCFKARSDHALSNGAGADDVKMPPLVAAAPKMAPYVPFKRTILEMNHSNGPLDCGNNNNKLISNNNNSHNAGLRLPQSKFSNGTSVSDQPPQHQPQRRIGSSGVHLWEVGQMPKNGSLVQEVSIANGSEVKPADSGTNGATSFSYESSKLGSVVKPGILKDKPSMPVSVPIKKASNQPGRRSSVVFIDESQVIGYGGNDYNWDDDESSDEPSDVDSLENYDLTEEDKVICELTDRNTEYNADNTNLLLSESRKPAASIFSRQIGGSAAAVADKLNPQSFYSMPTKHEHKQLAREETEDLRWASESAAHEWEDATPDWSTATTLSHKRDWDNAMTPEKDKDKAAADWNAATSPFQGRDWDTAAVPEKDSDKDAPDWSAGGTSLVQGSFKAESDRSDAAPLMQESRNTVPDRTTLVSLERDSDKLAVEAQTVNGAPVAKAHFRTNDATQHDPDARNSSGSDALSSSPSDQPTRDARCFINSLFSTDSEPTRMSFLTSEESEEDDGTFVVKPDTAPTPTTAVSDPSFAAAAHRAGSVTVPTRKHPVTHRATAQQLFNEEPVTAAELQAVSEKLPPAGAFFVGDPKAWLQLDENSSLMSTKPIIGSRNRNCSPYGIVPIAAKAKSDYSTAKLQHAPVIPSVPPPSSNDESQRYPYQPKGSQPSTNSTLTNGHGTSKADASKDASLPRTNLGPCSTFHSPAPRDVEARFRNREYAAVNYSCHYASSYITNGSTAAGNSALNFTTLPPTPLTNPYSSTAILKGIPQVPEHSPECCSPDQKPRPVTKPKPKLPVKPVVIQRKPLADDSKSFCDKDSRTKSTEDVPELIQSGAESPESGAGDRVSVYYQKIDGDDIRKTSSFESKVASLNSSLDFGKRTPKRQAPRPPTGSTNGRTPDTLDGQLKKKPVADHNVDSRRSSEQSSQDAVTPLSYVIRTSDGTDQYHAGQGSEQTLMVDHGTSELMPNEGSSSFNGQSGRMNSYSLGPSKTPSSTSIGLHYQKETPLFRENGKLKKSKFSLKKLLKFGSSSKEDGDDHRSKGKGLHHHSNGSKHERRTKLEILHPIDLINNAANEALTNEVIDPNSDQGSGSSSKTSSIGSHRGPAESVDIGHGTEPVNEKQDLDSSCADYAQSKYKPPPPPRSRSSTQAAEESTGSKDKPSRPPPPLKRGQALTRTPVVEEPHQEEALRPALRSRENKSGTNVENEENRNSVYSVGMEYANLGDVRNKLAPKKPGRCSSNSMMDISSGCEITNGEEANASGSQENFGGLQMRQLNGHGTGKTEVTYYAPTEEQLPSVQQQEHEAVDSDDLYADQAPAPSDQSPFSSINLDSLSSTSSSIVKTDPQPTSTIADNASSGIADKVYKRVALKGGSLEKVYAKMPVTAPPMSPESGSTVPFASSDPDESDLPGAVAWPRRKSSRLSLRKTKTVVHKNLEDNYGAVVSANHQTLTQILEQVTLTQQANASKVKMLEEASLHWSDFKLAEDSRVTVVGDKAFYSATWQQNVELTLMVSQDPLCAASHVTRNSCVMLPIVEFEDVIPTGLFSGDSSKGDSKASEEGYRRGTVWVLDRLRAETLASVAESLRLQSATDAEAYERETCFVLLQLINGLKHLQVLGIEEVDALATDFLLTMKHNDSNYRLVILPQSEKFQKKTQEKLSLCQSALSAMLLLLDVRAKLGDWTGEIPASVPSCEAFRLIADTLRQERATSLSQAKLLLEYLLWGPTDLQDFQRKEEAGSAKQQQDAATPEEELAHQRWLDLERATVLNNLIRTQSLWQIRLTVFEEYMLAFLVRTCAKTLRDAANQLRVNQ